MLLVEIWRGLDWSLRLPTSSTAAGPRTYKHILSYISNMIDLLPPAAGILRGALGLSFEVCGTP